LVGGYEGYLQADAYGVYHAQGVTEVACWAHARRKFYGAQDSDARCAAEMLALIGELYATERALKESCAGTWSELARDEQLAQIAAARNAHSVPVLDKIKAWLDTEGEIVLPRSPMADGLDPQQSLASVLAKIGRTPKEELDQFLPDVWNREDGANPPPTT
jgi:transposase